MLGILFCILVIGAILFFRKNDSDQKFVDTYKKFPEKSNWERINDVNKSKD